MNKPVADWAGDTPAGCCLPAPANKWRNALRCSERVSLFHANCRRSRHPSRSEASRSAGVRTVATRGHAPIRQDEDLCYL